MFRREFLLIGAGAALTIAGYRVGNARINNAVDPTMTGSIEGDFEIVKSDGEWRSILTEDQYQVLRHEATERAYTSPLNNEKRDGTYHCAGCDLALYESETKYDSALAGRAFTNPCRKQLVRGKTTHLSFRELKCIAGAVVGIWAIYSMTDQNRPVSVTASTELP